MDQALDSLAKVSPLLCEFCGDNANLIDDLDGRWLCARCSVRQLSRLEGHCYAKGVWIWDPLDLDDYWIEAGEVTTFPPLESIYYNSWRTG